MAKKIKSTTPKDEDVIEEVIDEEEEHEPRKIDKTEAALLLSAYIEADNDVTKVEENLDTAKKKRSDAAKAIYNSLGKGPFQFKGTYLGKIVVRDNNYFFRGKLDQELMSFD